MTSPSYPSLVQINTRVWLRRLSREAGTPVTLASIDDATIDDWAEKGFNWIWLLSVWQTGAAGRAVSRANPTWRAEFAAVLPDLTEDDICGSGFAISAYTVSEMLGGETALAQFRAKLVARGLKLMLDFVPNHTAPDHPWVKANPDYYVNGDESALATAPHNYQRVQTDLGPRIIAHGRDPNFPGWPDTLQLNYATPALRDAQIKELIAVGGRCDGVRCDMAMLLLPDVFERTWGTRPEPFWPSATEAVRKSYPAFMFAAEVYWDLEWTLQRQGFDYCYDKRLYDRLHSGAARTIREHLRAGLDYQDKLIRFLENHDEPRAATQFPWPQHRAAAAITFFSPGLRFFHQGQLQGARVRIPTHLCRGPIEPNDTEIEAFYARLLAVLRQAEVLRDGEWSQIDPLPAWDGNWTHDDFVAYAWTGRGGQRCIVVVNYAADQGQCRLRLPFPELAGRSVQLRDLMGPETYERDGSEMLDPGLFIDQKPWQLNIFDLSIG
jgi:glycosidase